MAQTVVIDNFDSYSSSTGLRRVWTIGAGSAAAASISLFTTDATTMPNSMALSTGNLPGFGDSSSARIDFGSPTKFMEGTLTLAFNVTPVTTRAAVPVELMEFSVE